MLKVVWRGLEPDVVVIDNIWCEGCKSKIRYKGIIKKDFVWLWRTTKSEHTFCSVKCGMKFREGFNDDNFFMLIKRKLN